MQFLKEWKPNKLFKNKFSHQAWQFFKSYSGIKESDSFYFRPKAQEDELVINPFVNPITAKYYRVGKFDISDHMRDQIKQTLVIEKPVKKALDIGCGTGFSTVVLNEIAEEVIGVDISAPMLEQAVQAERVTYQQAPAEKLPFADHQFDLITIGKAFHWMDQKRSLQEALRVLRPHGDLVIYDHRWVPFVIEGCMLREQELWHWTKEALLNGKLLQAKSHPKFQYRHNLQALAFSHIQTAVNKTLDCNQFIEFICAGSGFAQHTKTELDAENLRQWLENELTPIFANQTMDVTISGELNFMKKAPQKSMFFQTNAQAVPVVSDLLQAPTVVEKVALASFPGGIAVLFDLLKSKTQGVKFANLQQMLTYIIEQQLVDGEQLKTWYQNLQQHEAYGQLKLYIGQLALASQIQHLALSPDGNRRWAKQHDLTSEEGHATTFAERLPQLISQLYRFNLHTMTVWCTSVNNLYSRSPQQLIGLIRVLSDSLNRYALLAEYHQIRITHLGAKILSEKVDLTVREAFDQFMKKMAQIEKITAHYTKHQLNLAINYDGADDLDRALQKKQIAENQDINTENKPLSAYTDLAGQTFPKPDVHLRSACLSTGGRMGGAFLLESEHTHFGFTNKLGPDIELSDFYLVIADSVHSLSRYRSRDHYDYPVVSDKANRSTYQPRILGAGMLFIQNNRILLGKKKQTSLEPGTWAPPGGHAEENETMTQTAIRESQEEVGLSVEQTEAVGFVETTLETTGQCVLTLFFKAKTWQGELVHRELDQCEAWAWFPLDDLPKPLFSPFALLLQQQPEILKIDTSAQQQDNPNEKDVSFQKK